MIMEFSRGGYHFDFKEVYSGNPGVDLRHFRDAREMLKNEDLGLLKIDLSSVPEDLRIHYMAVTMGLFSDFNLKYEGIDKKVVEGLDWGIFRELALSSVQ